MGFYLGLRPKRSQSGDSQPQLGITKAGNGYLRQLLVECANHVMDLMERTLPCRSGVSALVQAAEVMREDELLWPLPVSLRFCYTASGSHRRSSYDGALGSLQQSLSPLRQRGCRSQSRNDRQARPRLVGDRRPPMNLYSIRQYPDPDAAYIRQ